MFSIGFSHFHFLHCMFLWFGCVVIGFCCHFGIISCCKWCYVIESSMNLTNYYLIVYPMYFLSDRLVLYFLINTTCSFSSQFWRQMELFFGLIIEEVLLTRSRRYNFFLIGGEDIAFLLVLSYIRKMI